MLFVFDFLITMAELFLFSIAESLITKLASRAYEEASRVLGLYDNLQDLKHTLSYLKSVLLDAGHKQNQNHELQEWLRQIKGGFSDAENVLDEFECEMLRKQVVNAHGGTKSKVAHFFSSSNPLVFRYRMAQQIKDINKRLDMVAADRNKFSLQIIDVDNRVVHKRELTHSRVKDSDVIGREHDKEKIIEILIQQQNPSGDDDNSLSVVPIVGIGGLGKTTLAKFVFNDKRIQECFPLKMWVCVSDDFDIKQVIVKIISSANDSAFVADAPLRQLDLNMLDMEQLQNQLRIKLADKKFLLVLDDIWNEDRVKWVQLRDLIQVGAEGSKILVTTRSHSIASMMSTVPSHVLEGLSSEDLLSLFVKWAFKEGEEEKYPHLVNIGREIVRKCRGIPLAVRTLGSLLFSKFETNEWEYVRDNEIWNLPQKKDDILPELKLSYDLLPSHLRQCFALFSLYPKDYEFNSFEVTWLWGAFGLLASPKKNRALEDVANQYLYELLSRSLLQGSVNYGTFYTFYIHDLVHDLALYVAKDECLLVNSHIQSIPENVRHLSFSENDLSFTIKSIGVRTILYQGGTAGAKGEALLNTYVSKYKYLRILDLRYSAYKTLPRSIGKLKHLRYFNIMHNHRIKRLPDSICKLENLQVLKLDGCTKLEALPKGLRKLISLRHLQITTKQSVLPDNEIANLSSLANLCIESSHNLESIFGRVKFPVLKTFYVLNCQSLKSLPLDVKNFPELENLCVEGCDNLDLQMSNGHHEEQSPKLMLKSVRFSDLPQLVALPQWLQEAANSLQSLLVLNCDNLEMLPEWLSTLTNLKTLTIYNCPKLVSLPDDIHCLTSLESLMIEGCPELCRKCQPHVGESWLKISHIKHIVIGESEETEEEEEELKEKHDQQESFDDTDKC